MPHDSNSRHSPPTTALGTAKAHAFTALDRGQWDEAYSLAVSLIKQIPQDPEPRFIAGLALLQKQRIQDAQDHLRHAIALNPKRSEFYLHLARACIASQDYAAALEAANTAEPLLHPANALDFDTLGVVLVQCHEYERATKSFRHAAGLSPDNAGMRFNLGTALIFSGDINEAERELEATIALNPHHWKAHHSLSQLRKQTLKSNHVERLSGLIDRVAGKVTATTFLNMALAKELEDLGDYERAFACLMAGKSAPKELLRYSRSKDSALFDALASGFPTPHSNSTTQGNEAKGPIFIVGMPRTGTTLVDRIISSHPQVRSGGELHNFPSVWKRAMGGQSFEMFNPEHIDRASRTKLDWRKIGEDYIASTRTLTGSATYFTDKLPHNFMYLGYIACALPNASIICVRRHPLDTCLSNFRQLFAPESPYFDYSYDLLDIGNYYILFDRLMERWKIAFPGRILEVQYELLVTAQYQASREIISHCGLKWDDACLSFDKNSMPVTTASAVQVRSPMYASALGRWKKYRSHLETLESMLRAAGINCD